MATRFSCAPYHGSVAPIIRKAILLNVRFYTLTFAATGVGTLVETKTGLWSNIALSTRSISAQFLMVAALVLCLTMAVLGTWVNQQIQHSVLVTSGTQASEFMRGFIEPLVQNLDQQDGLDAAGVEALDRLFAETPLGGTIVSIKIWSLEGEVLYATTTDLIGERFESSDVARAATGKVVAEYEDMVSAESAYEQTLPMHLIEVYAPIFRSGTREIVAVGEIYENANALAAELRQSQQTTWLVVAATTLFMIGILYLIVRRGAFTIARQRAQLSERYLQARDLAEQNASLRVIADRSRLQASEANEQFLARIGSDIHDGPIQSLALSTLRLSAALRALKKGNAEAPSPGDQIENAVQITQDALAELRNISTGLSLPELIGLDLGSTVGLAVQRHQQLTGDSVTIAGPLPRIKVSEALKICAYRIVQEGLTNATKHAPGADKQVRCAVNESEIMIEVLDEGPGISGGGNDDPGYHLGLAGIRSRVKALSGSVEIVSRSGQGTLVVARLPLGTA